MEQEKGRVFAVAQEILNYLYPKGGCGDYNHFLCECAERNIYIEETIVLGACNLLKQYGIIEHPNSKYHPTIVLTAVGYEIFDFHGGILLNYIKGTSKNQFFYFDFSTKPKSVKTLSKNRSKDTNFIFDS